MPSLTWKLKDPKSCEGCPNLTDQKHPCCRLQYQLFHWGEDHLIVELDGERPQDCIDELGE